MCTVANFYKLVLVVTIGLLVYIYLCYVDLKYFTKSRKNEPQLGLPLTGIDWPTDLPLQNLVEDQVQYPNLPIDLWMKHSEWSIASNVSAHEYPRIFNLQFSNNYWQVFQSTNETFQLLNAYYDNRTKNPDRPSIRILGMINTNIPTTKTYCLLWFEDLDNAILTKRIHYHWIWVSIWKVRNERFYQPYLLTCSIPQKFRQKIPLAVSVVENETVVTNVLRMIFIKPSKKKQFAVCVKGLDFLDLDISVRLVEWIELLKILGADNVYFYKLNVHPNISKVLEHYQTLRYIHVVPHTLPGEYVNIPFLQHKFLYANIPIKRFNEVIVYNDCLYRNLYSYEYIVLLDVDEMIVPRNTYTWSELLQGFGNNSFSICPRVGFFLDKMGKKYGHIKGIPIYLHMLQHVYRHKNIERPFIYTKCFHNPDLVISLHNHFPISHVNRSFLEQLQLSEAVLHHFRHKCTGIRCGKKFIRNIVEDKYIWKFKDELIEKSINTLKQLNFL